MTENSENQITPEPQIEVSQEVIVSPIEVRPTSVVSRAEKFIKQKSVQLSDEKRAIIMQPNLNEMDLSGVLSKADFAFYMDKKADYLMAYPDLGEDPFDLDALHMLIIEHIMLRNLLKRKTKTPSVDITKDYDTCTKRIESLNKSLATRRTDRTKIKGEKKQTINIASMSVTLAGPEGASEMEKRIIKMAAEEAALLKNPDKVAQ